MKLRVTQVWRDSWRAFLGAWPRLLALSLVLEVPVFILQVVAHGVEDQPRLFAVRLASDSTVLDVGVDVLLVGFYVSLGHHLLVGVLERMVGAEREGREVPPLGALVRTLPWGRLIVADVFLAVAINLGLVVLIVPGVLTAVWYSLVPVVLSCDRTTVRQAFQRSRSMVRGSFWPMLWLVSLALLADAVLGGLIGTVISWALDSAWSEALAHTLPSALLAPVFALPVVVAFFDLRALHSAGPSGRPAAP